MPLEPNILLHKRYRVDKEIASGGMGSVYLGHDESLDVEVAIKENLFVSPEAGRQFEREAKLLASLRHPNLPRVTDHFVLPDQGQYLVMDFIPGDTAHTRMKQQDGPLSESMVLQWANEILSALEYMHTRREPIIHRDIKPSNIKITPSGKAVLVDFGLAKVHKPSETTTVGARALTPGFAPPEQYGQGRTDMRTDIFSLGATLYALLTGRVPEDSIGREMGLEILTPIRDLNPSISANVARAIEHSLNTRPSERFESSADFKNALFPELSAEPTASASTERAAPLPATVRADSIDKQQTLQPSTRVSGRRFNPVLLGALAVVGVVAVGAGLILSGAIPGLTPTGREIARPTDPPPPQSTETNVVIAIAPTETMLEPTTVVPPPPLNPTDTSTPEITPTIAATPTGGGHGQIAFASEREGRPQVYLMNVDGSNQQRLTSLPDGACQPAWSPDGLRLLFVSPCRGKSDTYPNAAIYIMNADGSAVQPFIILVGGVYDPEWSEQGVVFTNLENIKPHVWTTNSEGRDAHQISNSNAYDHKPSWSPGGDKIVLINTSRSGSPTLYWFYNDGSFDAVNPDQVTRDQFVASPAWSPDGELIAYKASNHIWVIKWHALGFGMVRLTDNGPNDGPAWSPDGQWITFESWRDAANHDIYIMTVNGGLQTRLTEDPTYDFQPAWRP